MSRARVAMSRIAGEHPALALHASPQSPMVAFAVLIGFAVLAGGIAVAAADPRLSPVMGAFALMFVAAAFVAYWWTAMLQPRTVRIDTAQPALRFVQPTAMQPGFAILGLLALLPIASVLCFGLPSQVPLGPLLPLVVAGGAVVGLGQQAWALRTPSGLTLDERGLRGVRGSHRFELAWSELSSATIVSAKGARLVLNLRSGGVIVIDPHRIGSDPNVVAPVIDFFLRNPEHRAALATPRAALALAEA